MQTNIKLTLGGSLCSCFWPDAFCTEEAARNVLADLANVVILPTLEREWLDDQFGELVIELVKMDLPCRVDILPQTKEEPRIFAFMDERTAVYGGFAYRGLSLKQIKDEVARVVIMWIEENPQLTPEDRDILRDKCKRYLIE